MYTPNQYSKSRKILNKNVPGQYVFAEYFLHVSEEDALFNKILEEAELKDIPSQMVDSRIKHYLSKIKVLENKANFVAEWKNYPKFEFFQFVASHKNLFKSLENVEIKYLQALSEKIKIGEITVDQAFQSINLSPDEVASFVSSMIDDFKMGDD